MGRYGADLTFLRPFFTFRYGGYLYNDAAVRIVEQHLEPDANPLFIYLATQTMHAPVQVPSYYSDMYPSGASGPYTETHMPRHEIGRASCLGM